MSCKTEQSTLIDFSLVRRILLELLPLPFRECLGEDAESIKGRSDNKRRLWEMFTVHGGGSVVAGKHERIDRVENGVEDGDLDCRDGREFFLRNSYEPVDLLDGTACRHGQHDHAIGRQSQAVEEGISDDRRAMRKCFSS